MSRFIGLFRHELGMALRRRGAWVAYGLLLIFYSVLLFAPPPLGERVQGEVIAPSEVWSVAGRFMLALNVFFPVAVGLLSADRLERDFKLGVRELQDSTPLGRGTYILAKFSAALASALLPIFAWVLLVSGIMTALGHTPVAFLGALPVTFCAITMPAFAFVVAFSLACPRVMPLAVYQILFTGYWFWANFVPPKLFPTLNGTLLTPSGIFALQGFFSGHAARATHEPLRYTAADAALNLTVLALLIVAVLLVLDRHLARRARQA